MQNIFCCIYLKLVQPMYYNRSNFHRLSSLQVHLEGSCLGQSQRDCTRIHTQSVSGPDGWTNRQMQTSIKKWTRKHPVLRTVPPCWRKVMTAVPVSLSYSTLFTSPPPLLGLEKLISRRSFMFSFVSDGNTLESCNFLVEMSKWSYSGDSSGRRNQIHICIFMNI